MTDERNEHRGNERDEKPRSGLRLVPAPPNAPEPPADDDELRELIRQLQRRTKRCDSPPDDPQQAA